jgi:hypothetical protein
LGVMVHLIIDKENRNYIFFSLEMKRVGRNLIIQRLALLTKSIMEKTHFFFFMRKKRYHISIHQLIYVIISKYIYILF